MLDCKKALEETDGDFEKAVDFLRTKGLAAAAKKAGRAATEGMVAAAVSARLQKGVLLEINSETDFVAKNEKFQGFVTRHRPTNPAGKSLPSVEALFAQPYCGDSSKTIQTYAERSYFRHRRKHADPPFQQLSLFRVPAASVPTSTPAAKSACWSRRPATTPLQQKILPLPAFVKDVAMHAAAASPLYVQRSEVDADVLEREKDIYRAKAT